MSTTNLRVIGVILLTFASSNLLGQTADANLQNLTATVEAEKQFIAELQADLERHKTALLEISKRIETISTGTPAPAAETQRAGAPLESAPESTPPRFDFYGE